MQGKDVYEIVWLDLACVVLTWAYVDGCPIDTYAEVEIERTPRGGRQVCGVYCRSDVPRDVESYLADCAADRFDESAPSDSASWREYSPDEDRAWREAP